MKKMSREWWDRVRAQANVDQQSNWVWGDLILEAIPRTGSGRRKVSADSEYEEWSKEFAKQDIDKSARTLRDCRDTSAAYPEENADRSAFSWTVAYKFRGLEDRLAIIKAHKWTKRAAEEFVHLRNEFVETDISVEMYLEYKNQDKPANEYFGRPELAGFIWSCRFRIKEDVLDKLPEYKANTDDIRRMNSDELKEMEWLMKDYENARNEINKFIKHIKSIQAKKEAPSRSSEQKTTLRVVS
jgi:hypothetical protein